MRALPLAWLSLGLGGFLWNAYSAWVGILAFVGVWVLAYLAAARGGRT